jgi:DNA-binding transcriptional MerR regulator
MDKRYINIKQAAKILGVSALTLRNWDNSGKFPAGRHPISNYRVYDVKDLEQLLIDLETSKGRKPPSRSEAKKLVVKHLEADEE